MSKDKVATLSSVAWHISSYSANGSGQCVEAGAFTDGSNAYAVRDSEHPAHGHLTFTRNEWAAFVAGVTD
ncbi:protein of unknown function [Nocardiopsis flavescens]|uniref:DUF397 domain-containing protein n=1 Tax=Nocardiopsis flavescens TaxID=758803 RepID=A0A1M6RH40_9ACTN|nr:DUF397 domain-containing protein [Nocardiopsis flavescens]SHK31759.1 protein of unknown function [Nocardiopsis flavescens]